MAASQAWGTTARTSVYLAAILADALMEQGKLEQAAAALDSVGFGASLPAAEGATNREIAQALFVTPKSARLFALP